MIDIDGGDGGGQILRSALALASLTEQPVRIENIRGDRPEPGLKPQHLAVVETLAEITDADLSGATDRSSTVEFDPGPPTGGQYRARIGTAGSISLLFDAVLPLAPAIDEPLSLTATGGTEVTWSPPLLGHESTKLPLCRQFGLHAAIERHRTGFYPAGGGSATLHLAPSTLSSLSFERRGDLQQARCHSIASTDLEDSEVARRQARTARTRLEEAGCEVTALWESSVETRSTGSALVLDLEYEHARASFDSLGERGVPAETVASDAVDRALAFHEGHAAVDRNLADQLLVFLAVAGGTVRPPERTAHIESSRSLLASFGYSLDIDDAGDEVRISA